MNLTCAIFCGIFTVLIAFIFCYLSVIGGTTVKMPEIEKESLKVKIKYFNDELEKIKPFSCGDWVDLRSAEDVKLKAGEFHIINLGIGVKLPDGYEAYLLPRSSTFKNFKIIQANSMGVIDNSYSGEDDIWGMPVVALEDTEIHFNERICQFRINKIQPNVTFEEVGFLDETSRGGFGHTGTK